MLNSESSSGSFQPSGTTQFTMPGHVVLDVLSRDEDMPIDQWFPEVDSTKIGEAAKAVSVPVDHATFRCVMDCSVNTSTFGPKIGSAIAVGTIVAMQASAKKPNVADFMNISHPPLIGCSWL